MTSRNLFFKMMKEDLKRKIWAVSLAFLSFFFWMPVNAAMSISNLQQMYQRWLVNGTTFAEGITPEIRYSEKLLQVVDTTIGFENPLNAATISVAAIVLALTGFMYLHSRKQVDFYHSVPIKREMIFAGKYINGILIILVMYLLNMFLAMGILAANGLSLSAMLPSGFITFAVHAGGFFIIYSLMVIAVMLTGNFFISILGGTVLFVYIPAVIALVQGFLYLFFETINRRGMNLEAWMLKGSPISGYIDLLVKGAGLKPDQYGSLMSSVGMMVLIGLIMTVIALFLYKKRPSESAGKAMAFQLTKAPIKVLLVTPITIAASMLFWNIYYSLPWAVFGFVMGLAVSHAIVEIIYHFEFRKLFTNLHHMAVCGVLALITIAVFRFDLLGYDSYKPGADEFRTASVNVYNINQMGNYGIPYQYENGTGTHTSWRYMSQEDYVAENMKFTDYEIVEALADAGISEAETQKKLKFSGQESTENRPGFWTTLEIGYTLQNGKTKYRTYHVNVSEMRDVFDRLYENAEYKHGTLPFLSYEIDNITGVYESHDSGIQKVDADSALLEKIFNACKEETLALTLEERANETPVTSLRFLTIAEHNYIRSISLQNNPNFIGDFRMEDMSQVNFVPVYPSFEKTIALLKEAGVEEIGFVDPDDVLRVEIYSDYYTDEKAYYDAPVSYYEEQVQVYSAPGIHDADIKAYPVTVAAKDGIRTITLENDGSEENTAMLRQVLDTAVHHDLAAMNGLQRIEYGITARVYKKSINKDRAIGNQEYEMYQFPADEIPQFVRDAYEYDRREFKNINYGLNIAMEK